MMPLECNVKVSVIIPVYNSSGYLNRTIHCLQEQFFKKFEVIFVDDFSIDDSVSIIQQYMNEDKRIKLIQNHTHRSAGFCRNCGLEIATGEYVIFLDSDDYYYPNLLEIAYQRAKQENADVAVFGRELVDMRVPVDKYEIPLIRCDSYGNRVVYGDSAVVGDYISVSLVPWNKLVRRQFIIDNDIHFQDLVSNNDVYYSVAVMISAEKIVYINSILIRYCNGMPGSLTSGRKKKNYMPEAIAECITYAKSRFEQSVRYRTINEYLLRLIKNEIVSEKEGEKQDKKIERFRMFKESIDWINQCIEDKTLQNADICFLKALKRYHIGDDMTPDRLEILQLSSYIEKLHNSGRRVALWGCGIRGKRWLERMEVNKVTVDYVIDEDVGIQGNVLSGFTVQSYKSVEDKLDVILLMIADPLIVKEIKYMVKDKLIVEESELRNLIWEDSFNEGMLG